MEKSILYRKAKLSHCSGHWNNPWWEWLLWKFLLLLFWKRWNCCNYGYILDPLEGVMLYRCVFLNEKDLFVIEVVNKFVVIVLSKFKSHVILSLALYLWMLLRCLIETWSQLFSDRGECSILSHICPTSFSLLM